MGPFVRKHRRELAGIQCGKRSAGDDDCWWATRDTSGGWFGGL